MREVQSTSSVKSDDSPTATQQPSLVSKSVDSNAALSSSSASDVSAPNTGPTSTPQTTRKKTRRSSGRNQRPPNVAPLELPPVAPPPQAPQLPVLAAAKLDQLERKESEDSIKSTDSESASTSSNGDKSTEEKDEPERPTVLIPIEIRKPPPPLAKEPNTGQTMQMGDTPEEVEATRNEAEAPSEPVAVLSPKKDDRDRELVSAKVKGKKKQRQQLKKEEKLRRKEKEKAREREREKEKQQREREKKQVEELEHYIIEPVDKELSASNSSEQLDDEILDEPLSGEAQETALTGSPVTESPTTVAEFEDPAILDLKVEMMNEAPVSPSMIMIQQQDDKPRKQNLIAKLSAFEQKPEEVDGSEFPCPSPPQPPPTAAAKIPTGSEAVPSSAIKTSRGTIRSAAPKTSKDSESPDPFSRVPDRSTYASKKPAVKRSSLPDGSLEMMGQAQDLSSRRGDGEDESSSNKPKQRAYPPELDTSVDGADLEEADAMNEDILQEGMLLGVPKHLQHTPTSPHELAASLLSHNPAIKRRKQRTDKPDDPSLEDGDEKMEADAEKPPSIIEPEISEPEISHIKKRSTGELIHSPQKSHSHPGVSQMPKPPTTLSLDAQPFYPASDVVKPKNPPRHSSQRGKYPDPRKCAAPEYSSSGPPGLHHPMNMVPPGFSPEEAGMAFMGQYPEKQHYRKNNPRHLPPVSKLTPSPPYNSSIPEGQHFPFHEAPLEPSPQEPFGYEPSGFDSVDDSQLYPLPGGGGDGNPRFGGRSREHLDPAFLASLARDRRRHLPHSDAYLAAAAASLQQQRLAAAHRRAAARERNPGPLSMGAGSWDQQGPYHTGGLTPEEEEMIHRQRLLKKHNYMKALARKSAEALSSLNYPPYRGENRSPMVQPDLISPGSTNLWETMDPLDVLAHEDSFLSESVHAHQLRQQQLMQEQSLPPVRHPRPRTLSSSGSEIGGEYISDMQSPLHGASSSSSSSLAPPGLNRAPGTIRMDQQRMGGVGGGASSGHNTLLRSPGWPADTEVHCVL